MQLIFTGFKHEQGFRVFSFDRRDAGQPAICQKVRADLALARKYNIRLQDLPLLCQGCIDQSAEGSVATLTFTEAEMRLHQQRGLDARKAAMQKKKPARQPTAQTDSGSAGLLEGVMTGHSALPSMSVPERGWE